MAARIGTDGLWRVTYGELPGLSSEQLKERQPMKFEQMLPGHPKPDQYNIVNFSPYRVHQRIVPRMRVGRILLAADAAHRKFGSCSSLNMILMRTPVCNPFGGMGLTSGIVDIGGLYDCLAGVYHGKANPEIILEKYHQVRSQKFQEIIDPISSQNLVRLFGQDPDKAGESDDFLVLCKAAEANEKVQEQFSLGSMALSHDFTQYYHDWETPQKACTNGIAAISNSSIPVAVSSN
jgi:hypothetical protein